MGLTKLSPMAFTNGTRCALAGILRPAGKRGSGNINKSKMETRRQGKQCLRNANTGRSTASGFKPGKADTFGILRELLLVKTWAPSPSRIYVGSVSISTLTDACPPKLQARATASPACTPVRSSQSSPNARRVPSHRTNGRSTGWDRYIHTPGAKPPLQMRR